jgi:preprotein translocase subunit YajC
MQHLLNFFISPAYADAGSAAPQGGGFSLILMFIVFFLFIYFAVWRPQAKKAKEMQSLLSSLNKGDEVLTTGGMLGRISKISEQHMTLTISNNVDVVMQKSSVVTILPKGTLKAIE